MNQPRALRNRMLMMAALLLPLAQVLGQPTPPVAPATPAGTAISSSTIFALIEQLASEDFDQQAAAAKKLVEIGSVAIPMLRQTSETSDNPMLRVQAMSVLAQIEASSTIPATILSVHVKDASAQDVFKKLSDAYGLTFESTPTTWQNAKGPVTLDMDEQPFWTIMQEVEKRTGMGLARSDERFVVSPSYSQSGAVTLSGACLFRVPRITYTRAVQYTPAGGTLTPTFTVSMSAAMEPKVRLLRADNIVVLEEAIDDNGNSLMAPPPETISRLMGGSIGGGVGPTNLNVALAYPANPGKRITSLKGYVNMVVVEKTEEIEVQDVLTTKNLTRSLKTNASVNLTATVAGVEVVDGVYVVRTILESDGDWPVALFGTMNNSGRQVQLFDANGVKLSGSGGGGRSSARRNESTVRFGQAGAARGRQGGAAPKEPVKLVWSIPTQVRAIRVPFHFTDLPMP